MTDKTNVIIISFTKPHLFKSRFLAQWKKRFPTEMVHPKLANQYVKDARNQYDHVTLITDNKQLDTIPHTRFILRGSHIEMDAAIENIDVLLPTFFLTDRVFYEICSWLLEHRFPEKYNLL